MSSWDQAEKAASQHGGNEKYLNLKNDGDKAVIAILGEPHPREMVWTGERMEPYTGQDMGGKKPTLRIALNVFVDGQVKIFEVNATLFKSILKLRNKYGLDSYWFEVERSGAAGDTKTKYSILPERPMNDTEKQQIAAAELFDLARELESDGGDDDGFENYDKKPAAPRPIDEKTAQSMIVVLKSLPAEAVNEFLGKFGVKRIKDLPADASKAAIAYLDVLRNKFGGAGAEVDPFA